MEERKRMSAAKGSGIIGIIGGSGVYDMKIEGRKEVEVSTPFGKPSEKIVTGSIGGRKVAFLARHGIGHMISPGRLNVRANIFALKKLGVERIISASAVGSLKEELKPLDFVLPDQIFDRTKSRRHSFFEEGIVVHASFADPFCGELSDVIYGSAKEIGLGIHKGGTYLCMEGPQFSTRAESRVYRQMGMDVIGMTAVPEAKLAREAEICYSTIAMVTDYDVWKGEDVSVEMIISNLNRNSENVKKLLYAAIPKIPEGRECKCKSALATAIVTRRDLIPEKTKKGLDILIGKYLG